MINDHPATVVELVRRALVDDGLRVMLQPIIELSTGRIASEELLVRIATADGQWLSPDIFFPIVEEHGLAAMIDRVMIDNAAALAASGRVVNVNLSGATLTDECFYDDVIDAVARHGGHAHRITFEITETAVASDMTQASDLARRLAARGFSIALDDFGSGWGAIKYLKALPISTIKIGREFVRDVDWSPRARQVVRGIVALARELDQRVVAEGVEQGQTLSTLRALGVDRAQGFHIGRPRPSAL
ncbi:MAG TPA: EAL domain-containing protein [Thermoleophilaceae bacterium]|nr:EAL domain-containing protein [Thermoleophilaceae bacterium]